MLIKRLFIAIGSSIAIAVLFVILTRGIIGFLFSFLGIIALVFLASSTIMGKKLVSSESLRLLLPLWLFLFSAFGLSLVVDTQLFVFILATLVGAQTAIYLTELFYYEYIPARYEPHALESFATYLHLFTLFASASMLSALSLMVDLSWYWAVIFFLPFAAAVSVHKVTILNLPKGLRVPSAVLSFLVLSQIFAAASLLPTSPYMNGALVALAGYILHIISYELTEQEVKMKLIERWAFILLLLVILAFSSPWR